MDRVGFSTSMDGTPDLREDLPDQLLQLNVQYRDCGSSRVISRMKGTEGTPSCSSFASESKFDHVHHL